MAYRFLLEVPEGLAAQAAVAVDGTGDAQVILVRDSHGLGYDDPYVDLTVAAHSLRVIDTLYDWFDVLGASRPDIRLVLHGGERLALEEVDRGAMVGAIRRDQPWVERTIPKIGEHEEPDTTTAFTQGEGLREGAASATVDARVDAAGANAPGIASGLDRSWIAPAAAVATRRPVRFLGLNHVAVQVADLPKAERFYADFFGMGLLGRARRDARGAFAPINGDYRWEEAVRTGTEADVSFMANGPVALALHRVGRGARLERGILDHVSVAVDAHTYATLKGEVLMRSMQTLASGDAAFTFRDPFGVAWEVTVQGSVGRLPDLGI
jgi:catechol 2,3-dioxygenase-like lactoylglutathione lyase family enzyme